MHFGFDTKQNMNAQHTIPTPCMMYDIYISFSNIISTFLGLFQKSIKPNHPCLRTRINPHKPRQYIPLTLHDLHAQMPSMTAEEHARPAILRCHGDVVVDEMGASTFELVVEGYDEGYFAVLRVFGEHPLLSLLR